MGISFGQQFRIARYVMTQKLRKRQRFPLVLMLEPLFRCNLACAGCGKIAYAEEILNRSLSVAECLSAVDDCGTPIVSIAGGEPLMHKDMAEIVAAIVSRKKYVYLCTNGLLLKYRLKDYIPSSYLTLSIHIDGNRYRHDTLAGREGVYDQVVEAIKLACAKGFRVTVNCTLYEGVTVEETAQFLDFVMTLGVEGVTISPAYGYARASQKEIFLKRTESEQLFRDLFRIGRSRKWRFHHSGLFLDFLAGNQDYPCTPWGNPARNIFGWQRPCYLLMDEGHAPTFKALMEETDWQSYGPGRNPKCADCMLHSGFEPTAVNDALAHPLKAIRVLLRGPGADGTKAEGLQKKSSNIPPK